MHCYVYALCWAFMLPPSIFPCTYLISMLLVPAGKRRQHCLCCTPLANGWHAVGSPHECVDRMVKQLQELLIASALGLALLTAFVAKSGNFFFAGARLFLASLEAAIFLFSRVARIPEGSLVLPAICTEERLNLGAELANGIVIRGQNEISHPCAPGVCALLTRAKAARAHPGIYLVSKAAPCMTDTKDFLGTG